LGSGQKSAVVNASLDDTEMILLEISISGRQGKSCSKHALLVTLDGNDTLATAKTSSALELKQSEQRVHESGDWRWGIVTRDDKE
jgi:hypothetical protein